MTGDIGKFMQGFKRIPSEIDEEILDEIFGEISEIILE